MGRDGVAHMADTMALEISYCRIKYGSKAPILPSLMPATKKLKPADSSLDVRSLELDTEGAGGAGCGDGSEWSSTSALVSVAVAISEFATDDE